MKKLSFSIVLFALLSALFFSCKKADTSTSATATYYIKGKKDGVAFNFTNNAWASVLLSSGSSVVSLSAGTATSMEGFNIGINFANASAFQSGTYREDNSGSDYMIGGVYNPNSTTYVYAAGIQTSTNPLVINIVTKTSTEVSGTFSGAFYKQNVSGGFFPDFITVTEGEFKLQVK